MLSDSRDGGDNVTTTDIPHPPPAAVQLSQLDTAETDAMVREWDGLVLAVGRSQYFLDPLSCMILWQKIPQASFRPYFCGTALASCMPDSLRTKEYLGIFKNF